MNQMRSADALGLTLLRLDGRGYKAYKDIRGSYDFDAFVLTIEHVQGDPFAQPSRVRVEVAASEAGLPPWAYRDALSRRATADFLNRVFCNGLTQHQARCGSGKSGVFELLKPGQQILERTSMRISARGDVTARFRVGLPAHGRRIAGRAAATMFEDALVSAVKASLLRDAHKLDPLRQHCQVAEDSAALRSQLAARGLVAFVADGARLPRRSGVDDRPATGEVIAFEAPESLRVTLETPHAGSISGLGIAQGVTLIVGGGYHGKSTLLRAIERGYLDHIPGDGREQVVSLAEAVKVRAEDGRSVVGTDISMFIENLPGGADTTFFSTSNASGSTSQAAAIAEALEQGARCLLLDEDTCATNFMIRDARMQALIAAEDEPITPFLDRVRSLYEEKSVSSVLVIGGSGDYFDVADTVIAMKGYRPIDVTGEARAIAKHKLSGRVPVARALPELESRSVERRSLAQARGDKPVQLKVQSHDHFLLGREEVRIGCIEQLVERAQVRAIGQALICLAKESADGPESLQQTISGIMERVRADGLEDLQNHPTGDLAEFRRFELAAVLGRLRTLTMLES
ncbi:MAG: ABC-ATPase domain-containing protein [Myxococcota bacterium]|nr:ABC-ATPase domain-containing protein [Myxococcota bacterium]